MGSYLKARIVALRNDAPSNRLSLCASASHESGIVIGDMLPEVLLRQNLGQCPISDPSRSNILPGIVREKPQAIEQRGYISGESCAGKLLDLWTTIRLSIADSFQSSQPHLHFHSVVYRSMLLDILIKFAAFAIVCSAAVTPSLQLIKKAQLSPSRQKNISATALEIPPSLNGSRSPITIDPRFTYDTKFADQILDKNSAYLSTLLALANLSTMGWTHILRWEEQYEFSQYGDVTIRIHASQNPSTLQYRYAIWGLYSAIRESSANGFKECVLTLYWSPRVTDRPNILGYVSILGETALRIDGGDSTEKSPELPSPTQKNATEPALANLTTLLNISTIASETTDNTNIKIELRLLGRPLDFDAVFVTIYAAIVYLASFPQSQPIIQPGLVRDSLSRTVIRWDSSHLTIEPRLEYRDVVLALTNLAVYMSEQNRFEEARFVLYVDEIETGRGWMYRSGAGGVSNAE